MTAEAVKVAEAPVLTVDGRRPGARGMATRARLLECTRTLLVGSSYRDLAVVEIARATGTSPATFYQYFPDVESAVLALAGQMADERHRLSSIVRATNWVRPAAARKGARDLAAEFLAFWIDHQPILRVVDLASTEGDPRFRALRTRLLNDVTNALAEAVTEVRSSRSRSPGTDPMAVAAVLVSMLSHVAAHRAGLESWGIAADDTQAVMADLVYKAVTAI
jgi:AcrR family transcriptional regulator